MFWVSCKRIVQDNPFFFIYQVSISLKLQHEAIVLVYIQKLYFQTAALMQIKNN